MEEQAEQVQCLELERQQKKTAETLTRQERQVQQTQSGIFSGYMNGKKKKKKSSLTLQHALALTIRALF